MWLEEYCSVFGETSPIFLQQRRRAGIQMTVNVPYSCNAVIFEAVLCLISDIHTKGKKIFAHDFMTI